MQSSIFAVGRQHCIIPQHPASQLFIFSANIAFCSVDRLWLFLLTNAVAHSGQLDERYTNITVALAFATLSGTGSDWQACQNHRWLVVCILSLSETCKHVNGVPGYPRIMHLIYFQAWSCQRYLPIGRRSHRRKAMIPRWYIFWLMVFPVVIHSRPQVLAESSFV